MHTNTIPPTFCQTIVLTSSVHTSPRGMVSWFIPQRTSTLAAPPLGGCSGLNRLTAEWKDLGAGHGTRSWLGRKGPCQHCSRQEGVEHQTTTAVVYHTVPDMLVVWAGDTGCAHWQTLYINTCTVGTLWNVYAQMYHKIICLETVHIQVHTQSSQHTIQWKLFCTLCKHIDSELSLTDPFLQIQNVGIIHPLSLLSATKQ